MKKILALLGLLFAVTFANAQIVQFSGAPISGGGGGACVSGATDTVAASPGSYTIGQSFRKLRAAYSGSAMQLQKNVSGNPTQDIGFNGCDNDSAAVASFCGTASLAATPTSSRVAVPAGSTSIFVWASDKDGAIVYVKLGNSSVTATTADTMIPVRAGTWLSVGANTHLAAITITTTVGSSTGGQAVKMTNCGVSIWYDQINANNAVQATQSKQFGFFSDALNGKPGAVCNGLTDDGTSQMLIANNASYKTAVVHQFLVTSPSQGTFTQGTNKSFLNYPNASNSDSYSVRFGLAFGPNPDQLNFSTNNSAFVGNIEGYGQALRMVPAVYDVSTSNGIVRSNNTRLMTGSSSATTTYGTFSMVLGGAANGSGCANMVFQEFLMASATQTTPANLVNNMMTYWGITTPSTSKTTPDGFTYTADYWGGFAPSPPGPGYYTVNGRSYASEGSWNDGGIWQATNVKTSGTTSLGDMWRFEMRDSDEAWINITGMRNELDMSPTFSMALDTIYYIAYAFQVESGSSGITQKPNGADWNILGQAHGTTNGAHDIAAPFYVNVFGGTLSIVRDNVANPSCTPNVDCQIATYTSGSTFAAPGTWLQVFIKVRKSTSGTTDIFQMYIDPAGTTPLTVRDNCTGTCFFTDTGQLYWKYGIYRGFFEPLNSIPWTQAVRFGNMQLTTTDISAQITTPLDVPTH